MSVSSAEQVIFDTVQAAEAEFGDEIEAIFSLGSLAHGGFAPLVSDVDLAVVLRSTTSATADRISRVQSLVGEKASSPLSERLSLFWGDWDAVRTGAGTHKRLGPVDRLDLLDSGRLLCGSDLREPCVRPSHEELVVMSADHILNRFTDEHLARLADTEALVDAGPRVVTKAVLFPVRFMYTLREGRIGLNEDSGRWYAAAGLPGSDLAIAALRWRNAGIDGGRTQQMLDADLPILHVECFTEYARELDGIGDAARAGGLAERAASVHVVSPDLH